MIRQHVLPTIEEKLQAGLQPISGKKILHTAPHHDDILLGYFPYFIRHLAHNQHHVLYLTSGANGVSDNSLAEHLALSKKDIALFDEQTKQELKYRLRESESERKWSECAGNAVSIHNFRAEFYEQVDPDACAQAMERDIVRCLAYLQTVQPDIITLLVDPVGIGPSTHYRSQQVVVAALARYNPQHAIQILGYRNIWSSFTIDEATMIIPVTQAEQSQVLSIFADCFASQNQKFIMNDCNNELGYELQNFAQQAIFLQKEQLQHVQYLLVEENKELLATMTGAIFLQECLLENLV